MATGADWARLARISVTPAAAVKIAVMCGTWLGRAMAALDFALLVFGGQIFAGLSHLDVSAVGHLAAMLTAVAGVTLILARRDRSAPVATGQLT